MTDNPIEKQKKDTSSNRKYKWWIADIWSCVKHTLRNHSQVQTAHDIYLYISFTGLIHKKNTIMSQMCDWTSWTGPSMTKCQGPFGMDQMCPHLDRTKYPARTNGQQICVNAPISRNNKLKNPVSFHVNPLDWGKKI